MRTVLKRLSLHSIHESTPEVIIPTPPQEQSASEPRLLSSDNLLLSHQKGIRENGGISKLNEHVLVWNTDNAFVSHIGLQSGKGYFT